MVFGPKVRLTIFSNAPFVEAKTTLADSGLEIRFYLVSEIEEAGEVRTLV